MPADDIVNTPIDLDPIIRSDRLFQLSDCMRTVALYEMLFGILTMAGGVIGYVSAESWISLVTGLVAGMVMVGAALKMQKGSRSGLYVELVMALALGIWSGIHYFSPEGKLMPFGLIMILSIISLLLLVLLLVQPAERKRIF
jgi:uncharacterized membrane protein (UPF0136 family)